MNYQSKRFVQFTLWYFFSDINCGCFEFFWGDLFFSRLWESRKWRTEWFKHYRNWLNCWIVISKLSCPHRNRDCSKWFGCPWFVLCARRPTTLILKKTLPKTFHFNYNFETMQDLSDELRNHFSLIHPNFPYSFLFCRKRYCYSYCYFYPNLFIDIRL